MSQEKQEGEFSLKGKKTKPKNLGKKQDGPIKVDLSTPVEKKNEEQEVTKVVIGSEEKQSEENANTEQEAANVVEDQRAGAVQEVGEQLRDRDGEQGEREVGGDGRGVERDEAEQDCWMSPM